MTANINSSPTPQLFSKKASGSPPSTDAFLFTDASGFLFTDSTGFDFTP